MTDISVSTYQYQVDSRPWLVTAHGTEGTPSIPLRVASFTAATHYPNGYLLAGIVLGKITASGLYAPYVDAAVDGTGTAAGILFASVRIPDLADLTHNTNGALVVHAFIDAAKLPIANAATGGGFLDANGRVDLNHLMFI